MAMVDILLELPGSRGDAFAAHAAAFESEAESVREAEQLLTNLSGYGLEPTDLAPVPIFGQVPTDYQRLGLQAFASHSRSPDLVSVASVVPCQVRHAKLAELQARNDVTVWPNSPLVLLNDCGCAAPAVADFEPTHLFDRAASSTGVDCRPFKPAATIDEIRQLLGVEGIWNRGYRGQNIVVGIIDEGVNGSVYPVVGGFSRPNAARTPGSAPITSHGSMCAADVLIAAPATKIYDYPFLGIQNSGGALTMFQAVLNQRRIDGTPHITSNSYGYRGKPPQHQLPNHEVWDPNHPVHRKVREVIASGAPSFFSAGNCGEPCPAGCHPSGIGPRNSIHASSSLEEVISVAAVNSRHDRIGYSAQGPGGFHPDKPDVSAYSHIFANFGPGRPGGTADQPFDSGTSTSCPVAAGVGALLLSAFPDLDPPGLKQLLIDSAYNIGSPGWDADTGHGVVNAAAAFSRNTRRCK